MFWVISVYSYFNIRNTLPKSGTFLLGHPVYVVRQLRVNSISAYCELLIKYLPSIYEYFYLPSIFGCRKDFAHLLKGRGEFPASIKYGIYEH